MFLVGVHSQVTTVTSDANLVDRTLSHLVVKLAEEALQCFRQVERFGMGGMLRVCSVNLIGFIAGADIACFRPLSRLSSCIRH